jgi:hypothetical protein
MPIGVMSTLKILIEERRDGYDYSYHWRLQGGVVGQSLQESIHTACCVSSNKCIMQWNY